MPKTGRPYGVGSFLPRMLDGVALLKSAQVMAVSGGLAARYVRAASATHHRGPPVGQ